MKLIECIPNISEGRDLAVVRAIVERLQAVPGVALLNVDSGYDANRTVVTFAGGPAAVADGAFALIAAAAELIDMRKHRGAHSRIGATDVCPFVPVRGVSMEECVELSRSVAARVGNELGIPVFLYERSATRPERKRLENIRRGEYEGLSQKLRLPEWAPDYGPTTGELTAGATVMGARQFLIAYNVNLDTRDVRMAGEIAAALRESGRRVRVGDAWSTIPGRLSAVKAIGWYMESFGCAQVSMNLTDFETTGLHQAYTACMEEAQKRGVNVTGSELIGLVPLAAMLSAGRYFRAAAASESELIAAAHDALGLSSIAAFDGHSRILEYILAQALGATQLK